MPVIMDVDGVDLAQNIRGHRLKPNMNIQESTPSPLLPQSRVVCIKGCMFQKLMVLSYFLDQALR